MAKPVTKAFISKNDKTGLYEIVITIHHDDDWIDHQLVWVDEVVILKM